MLTSQNKKRLLSIIICCAVFLPGCRPEYEKTAEDIITKLYTADRSSPFMAYFENQDDEDDIENVKLQAIVSDEYENLFTAEGYEKANQNALFLENVSIAYKSDLEFTVKDVDFESGGKSDPEGNLYYSCSIILTDSDENSHKLEASGVIRMKQSGSRWYADSVRPDTGDGFHAFIQDNMLSQ